MTLTPAQTRARSKLTDQFRSAADLDESLATLNALVSKGIARKRIDPGAGFADHRRYLTKYKSIT